jgi:hypothetical protein
MKGIYLIGLATMLVVCVNAQDKIPPEVKSARSRYDATVKLALDPIRLRYLEELARMKASAMSQKNLDLAKAIDEEINVVNEASTPGGGLASKLVGTTWSWGKTQGSAASTLRFIDRDTYTINEAIANTEKWTVVNGTTVKLGNGSTLKFDFGSDTYDGTTPSGEARVGRKLKK